jgi:hypothetical protein
MNKLDFLADANDNTTAQLSEKLINSEYQYATDLIYTSLTLVLLVCCRNHA